MMPVDMKPIHGLYAFEEDFIEDGTKAVCVCGWRSSVQIDPNKSMERLKARYACEDHVKAAKTLDNLNSAPFDPSEEYDK